MRLLTALALAAALAVAACKSPGSYPYNIPLAGSHEGEGGRGADVHSGP
jgi:hypothetical protein